MSRNWHILKPNKANRRPTRHLFVDIETRLIPRDDGKTDQVLRLGWCCYWRREGKNRKDTKLWYRFESKEAFWDIVWRKIKPKEPLYVVAHNVDFDFGILGLFDAMVGMEFELKSIYLSGTTDIIRFCSGQYTVYILDNGNFFPGKLETLGEAIGFPKMDVDPLNATDAEIDPYCKRDVEIMLKAWEHFYRFLSDNDLGNWGKTLPSQAFNAYRHRFMPYPIMIHNDTDALKLERDAYHGGRVSVFYQGKLNGDTYYKLDVNSMYPYVMRNHVYPRKLWRVIDGMGKRELQRFLKSYLAIAQVEVDTDVPIYPVTHKGRLVHPVGRFETTLCTPELEYALDHGHLVSVKRVVLYEGERIFTNYVDFFYALKRKHTEEGNKPYRTMTKLYLNTLYGKFGQKRHSWDCIDDPMLIAFGVNVYVDARTGRKYNVYRFDGRVWVSTDKGEAYNSFPAIAAHVTAYARMYLWKLLLLCGEGNYLYCDTDSIIVASPGLRALSSRLGTLELGALKIEETAQSVDIRCPKCYQLGDKWKRKGVPSKARYLGADTWEYDQFPSFRRQVMWDDTETFHTTRVQKHLTYKIHDGVVLTSGWVLPIMADELWPKRAVSSESQTTIEMLVSQREALRDAKRVPHSVVFRLWDYRKGTWRRQRDSHASLVPIEYSRWDDKADELGFQSLDRLQEAVTDTLGMEAQIAKITLQIHSLQHPQDDTTTPGEMRF